MINICLSNIINQSIVLSVIFKSSSLTIIIIYLFILGLTMLFIGNMKKIIIYKEMCLNASSYLHILKKN